MYRTPVTSSTITSAGYDPAARKLELEFTSGNIYLYLHVPETIYIGLMAASSKGSYFNEYIRERFEFEKVR